MKNRVNLVYFNFVLLLIITAIFLLCLFPTCKIDNKSAKAITFDNKIKQISIKNDKYINEYQLKLAENNELNNSKFPKIFINYQNKKIEIKENINGVYSDIQKEYIKNGFIGRLNAMNFAYKNGFSEETAISYAFPEIKETVQKITRIYNTSPKDSKIISKNNTGKIEIINSKKGVCIDKNAFFKDVFYKLNNFSNKYVFDIKNNYIEPEKGDNYYKQCLNLRGSYTTYFGSSSESRKNNIKKALSMFDGVIVLPGEILSFNQTTGLRTEENGYQKAKIIKNGTFYNEFGGGVCQVSTTLYNAALLSDLEIVEVNPHSLPISYEEPCFDAMVNSGSSDLVIKNNTQMPIIIATSSQNDSCLVNIYGVENKYKIVRKSEKVEEILQFERETTSDYATYGFDAPLCEGESRLISKGKSGYKAIGKLEYYLDGVLVKTKHIRSNTYKPTKEVVLVS